MLGKTLRNRGITSTINHADKVVDNWSGLAYAYLEKYCMNHPQFMIEDVRLASCGIVPEPPNSRAWGAIAAKAARNNLVRRFGYRNVTNSKAHCTPATVWCVVGRN